ncbi:DEKNAAC105496 [Brettanomyces naardenensis]|uniref:DEKNAAC105497 n=1 Tax=Brettanomyces naardenensis TaxID=13370 RepID=A0A448YTV9_BRENA|nr:DEKNAAC105496 [Brettanomyces naardenensis]
MWRMMYHFAASEWFSARLISLRVLYFSCRPGRSSLLISLTIMSGLINRSLIRTFEYAKQPQLYVHELTKDLTKISFSKDPSTLGVGTLKGLAIPSGRESQLLISTKNFIPNPEFLWFLQDLFHKKVYGDVTYQLDALNFRSSYLPIGDFKVILQYMNQRPEYENTLGFVLVDEDGAMVEDSYQPNEIYELCNSDGIVTLSEYMLDELRNAL